MTWTRYSGIIKAKSKQMRRLKEAAGTFPVTEFFLDAGKYLLIDGIYPDVTRELRLLLKKLKEEGISIEGKIQIGAAHIREIRNWATEEINPESP